MTTDSCSAEKKQLKEIQLTDGAYGHFLNSTQAFSPDDKWIVYDTRNDDGGIGVTGTIEMVSVAGRETKLLYRTQNQTSYGPGVGAATFSPVSNRVLFIHGIRNADEKNPYGMTRRTAVAIDIDNPLEPIFMDARDVTPPFTVGALRGGTHAYSWSGDGEWVCFTYNDYVVEQLSKTGTTHRDLRTIAVMTPGKVIVPPDNSLENNSGEKFSVTVAAVTENPHPGSDEIDKAFDEGWVGKKGYRKTDGTWQNRAVAFQGNVRNQNNEPITEIFITDIPDDVTQTEPGKPLEGTINSRPNPPGGCRQRRLTHTGGLQGPRHWLKSLSDGSLILFLNRDQDGIVQVFGVSPNGGAPKQITFNKFSVEGSINISPDDIYVSYVADNSVFITDIKTGTSRRLTVRTSDDARPQGAVVWSNAGNMVAYNRKTDGFYQIFLLNLKP
ncbi:MAG: DUF3748 domain-containing protein [Chitinophagaceae bacterium]|nr:DUF3748 domain-containing protein [Chitinophagaceae bacterium]MCW5928705.1 DUF3748 domain-containing protein [Chitinophagaceae bacterium]